MCGIFGVMFDNGSKLTCSLFKKITKQLFLLSESRGKEASGLALLLNDEIKIIKKNVSARDLMMTRDYQKFMNLIHTSPPGKDKTMIEPLVLVGHSRLVTTGTQENHSNNQPLIKNGMAVVHNGIIVNADALWHAIPGLVREEQVDTEIIPALIERYYKKEGSLVTAVRFIFQQIEGTASIAILFSTMDYLLLTSNNGSLYMAHSLKDRLFIFASEKFMLKNLQKRFSQLHKCDLVQVKPNEGFLINISNFEIQQFGLLDAKNTVKELVANQDIKRISDISRNQLKSSVREIFNISVNAALEVLLEDNGNYIARLKRCTKCILPQAFPFIVFNEDGVCNVCKAYRKIEYKGIDALKQLLLPLRKDNNAPDVLVCLSGGRDSTFMLHYLKTKLDMHPVAYTYDWGMVTDLARRNIARVTGKLGIEHILISADINKKRSYIRRNINAWLGHPSLGMIPLFMAGDKQLFYYANILKMRMSIAPVFFGMNLLERTDFKVAFCGFNEREKEKRHYYLSNANKLKILKYYTKEMLKNPAYFNNSLFDSLFAFFSYYIHHHDYHLFYEYCKWDEVLINEILKEEYNWECAEDTSTTWRIGDGTAPFYNYIYYTVAGFSEIDTFRSNQVREGILSRDTALQLALAENKPRFHSLLWYCDTIGIDFATTIKKINSIPKLYRTE